MDFGKIKDGLVSGIRRHKELWRLKGFFYIFGSGVWAVHQSKTTIEYILAASLSVTMAVFGMIIVHVLMYDGEEEH